MCVNLVFTIITNYTLVEIRSMAKCVESPSREVIRALEKKLDKCRNQENNPDSEM